jgi:hypothetical protein
MKIITEIRFVYVLEIAASYLQTLEKTGLNNGIDLSNPRCSICLTIREDPGLDSFEKEIVYII